MFCALSSPGAAYRPSVTRIPIHRISPSSSPLSPFAFAPCCAQVVRELVMCLHYSYGVPPANVLGVVNGYRGFYDAPLKVLTPSVVSAINREVSAAHHTREGGDGWRWVCTALGLRVRCKPSSVVNHTFPCLHIAHPSLSLTNRAAPF